MKSISYRELNLAICITDVGYTPMSFFPYFYSSHIRLFIRIQRAVIDPSSEYFKIIGHLDEKL